MADNTTLNTGSGGDTISTDDIGGGVKVQRVKVQYGVDGSATDVSDTNPMPVDDAGGSLTVDDGGVSLTVDGSVTANAGTNLNTSLLALESGGNLDSAVSSLSSIDGTLTTVAGDTANLSVVGGGTEAAAIRVTLANNSTGVLSVDDNGGALTVDNGGTFAVQDSTTQTNTGNSATSLAIIDDWDESDRCKVNLIAGQAGIAGGTGTDGATVPRVTLATNVALPAGTNAIGKLAANSGVDIGDVDVTSISAGANLIGDVGLAGTRTSGGTTPYKNLDVDESEDDVKTSAGQVYWIHAMNLANAKRYLKFYNATAANVTVGTTTPVLTFSLPTQGDTNGAGFTLSIPNGIAFSTAICIAATTGVADNDTGAPGANEVVVCLGYA